MENVRKITGWNFKSRVRLDSRLTESFRELSEKRLGKLDTATSFMYLYNRFGKPNVDSRDEYKILYEYRFVFKDLSITVHASYHDHVYFGLFVKWPVIKPIFEEQKDYVINLGKRALKNGIGFYPTLFFNNNDLKGKYKNFAIKNDKIIQEQWQKYFLDMPEGSFEEYKKLEKENSHEAYIKYYKPFSLGLVEKFNTTLTPEERKRAYDYETIRQLSTYPEILNQAEEFFEEMKIGSWIRDVPVNIKGYETEENEILEEVDDEE